MEYLKEKCCRVCGESKTIDHFKKTRWGGYVSVCNACANQKRHDNRVKKQQEKELEKARVISAAENKQKILESFTPRELMKELSRRGYCGELTYTQRIDICNF